jgi:hypothetical protein
MAARTKNGLVTLLGIPDFINITNAYFYKIYYGAYVTDNKEK